MPTSALPRHSWRRRAGGAYAAARSTTSRASFRLRRSPPRETFDVAVFNPSPHPRTDVVRFALDPTSWFEFGGDTSRTMAVHPWLRAGIGITGYSVGGEPARLLADGSAGRQRLTPD